MPKKILIPLYKDSLAPRFDLATEVLIGLVGESHNVEEKRVVVLPEASPEEVCNLIFTEGIDVVICCAIEKEYYDYLVWKKIQVFDSVVGSVDRVLRAFEKGELSSGDIIVDY